MIAAALSIQDVRERPADQQAQADQAHARHADETLGLPRLPEPLALPARAPRRAVGQPVPQAGQGRVPALPADPRVAGPRRPDPPGGQGRRDQDHPHPGRAGGDPPGDPRPGCSRTSACATPAGATISAPAARASRSGRAAGVKGQPSWVMVAELVETSRLWGRTAARIDPRWVEPLAEHLLRRTYDEPRWEKKRASVVATERVDALRPADRRRPRGRLRRRSTRCSRATCSSAARWSRATGTRATTSSPTTRALVEEVEALEERARRRDILVDDQTLYDFYAARIPDDDRLRRATSTAGGATSAACGRTC